MTFCSVVLENSSKTYPTKCIRCQDHNRIFSKALIDFFEIDRNFQKPGFNEHPRLKRRLSTKLYCNQFSGLGETTVEYCTKRVLGVKITNPTELFKIHSYSTYET